MNSFLFIFYNKFTRFRFLDRCRKEEDPHILLLTPFETSTIEIIFLNLIYCKIQFVKEKKKKTGVQLLFY